MARVGEAEWRAVARFLPVVAVAGLSQAGVGLEHAWAGSGGELALTSLLLAAPLLVRDVRPVLACAAMAVALVVQVALGGSLHFASFVAVLVASYAAGRRAPARSAAAGAALLLAGIVVAMRASVAGAAEELVFPFFYVTAAAVIGSVVRRQARQAADLRRLNDALVRERDALDRLAMATERLRLARELHDVVAHTLTVVVIQAEACEEALPDEPGRAADAAREVQAAGRRGLTDLRSLVRVLRDADAAVDEPSLGDLDALAGVMTAAGLDVTVERRAGHAERGSGADLDADPDLQRELYRIAQEALTNIVKHSAAGTAHVVLDRRDGRWELEVVDPGPALGSPLATGGHGLAGMAERLAPLGGRLSAGPHGDGFRVHASAPARRAVPT